MYEVLTITVEVDKQYGVIVEASCTLATEHGRRYVRNLLKGYSLIDGVEKPKKEIENHYMGKAENALTTALNDLYKQYQNYNKKKN